jgi:hypothetical protein
MSGLNTVHCPYHIHNISKLAVCYRTAVFKSSIQNSLFLICLKNDKPDYENEEFFIFFATFMFSTNNLISISSGQFQTLLIIVDIHWTYSEVKVKWKIGRKIIIFILKYLNIPCRDKKIKCST